MRATVAFVWIVSCAALPAQQPPDLGGVADGGAGLLVRRVVADGARAAFLNSNLATVIAFLHIAGPMLNQGGGRVHCSSS